MKKYFLRLFFIFLVLECSVFSASRDDDIVIAWKHLESFMQCFHYAHPSVAREAMQDLRSQPLSPEGFMSSACYGSVEMIGSFKKWMTGKLTEQQLKPLDLMAEIGVTNPSDNAKNKLSDLFDLSQKDPSTIPPFSFPLLCRMMIQVPSLREKLYQILMKDNDFCTVSHKDIYALMLVRGHAFVSFDGKIRLNNLEMSQEEVARLYRDSKTPEARVRYAGLLFNRAVYKTFDGITTLNHQNERDTEGARLLRKTQTRFAKEQYLVLLLQGRTKLDFNGQPFSMSHYRAAADLASKINTPETCVIYAALLKDGHTDVSLKGKKIENQTERYAQAARLLRAEPTSEHGRFHYATMLLDDQTVLSFKDERPLLSRQECYDEAARLLRNLQTKEAAFLYAQMLVASRTSYSFDGRPLNSYWAQYNEMARLFKLSGAYKSYLLCKGFQYALYGISLYNIWFGMQTLYSWMILFDNSSISVAGVMPNATMQMERNHYY